MWVFGAFVGILPLPVCEHTPSLCCRSHARFQLGYGGGYLSELHVLCGGAWRVGLVQTLVHMHPGRQHSRDLSQLLHTTLSVPQLAPLLAPTARVYGVLQRYARTSVRRAVKRHSDEDAAQTRGGATSVPDACRWQQWEEHRQCHLEVSWFCQ